MKNLKNVEDCVKVRGVALAVDLLTAAHEAPERTSIPLQSNLIAATAFMEPQKEWMIIDHDGNRVGPLEKDAVKHLWSRKSIDWTTKCWALGMADWKQLRDIRELRWALASKFPVLTPTQVIPYFLYYFFTYQSSVKSFTEMVLSTTLKVYSTNCYDDNIKYLLFSLHNI